MMDEAELLIKVELSEAKPKTDAETKNKAVPKTEPAKNKTDAIPWIKPTKVEPLQWPGEPMGLNLDDSELLIKAEPN